MPQVIDELVTILGFDMDSRAGTVLGKFNKGIDSIAQNARQASMAVVAASAAVSYFVVQLNKASGEVEKLGRVTGISTDTIQEMSFAMEQVGGNAASMKSDLVSLMLSMNSPIPGEFNEGLFLLGISTKKANGELKNVDDVLLDIADKMQGMSKQKQMQWGNKIGISKDTIMLLQEGRGEIERLRKQAAQIPVIIDPENLKNAREFNRQISLIGRVFSFLGQTVASAAGPAIKDIVAGLMEWLKINKELIQSGLKAFINGVVDGFVKFTEVVRLVIGFVSELLPGLGDLTKAITATEAVSILVFSALTALAIPLVVLISQFLLIGAVVAAAGLIINDFVVYLEGGESVIGELIQKVTELWKVFGEKFPAMADFLGEFFGVLKTFASFLKDTFFVVLDKFVELLKLVGKGWGLIAGLAEKGLESLGFGDDEEILAPKIQEVTKKVKTEIIPEAKKMIEPMQKPVASMWSKIQDWTFGKIQKTVEAIQPPKKKIQEKIEAIREPVKVAQEKIKEPMKVVQEKIKEPMARVDKIQEKLQAPIVQIKEKIKEPIAKMREKAQVPIVNIQEKIKEPMAKIQEKIKEPVARVGKIREKLQAPIIKIQEKIKEPMTKVAKIQEKIQEPMVKVAPIHEKLQALIFKIQEKIKEPVGKMQIGILTEMAKNATTELKKLNINGNVSKNIEAVSAPIAPVSTQNNTTSEQNIVNNVDITVTGNNAPAVASEVSYKLKTALYPLYPGGLAPAVQ